MPSRRPSPSAILGTAIIAIARARIRPRITRPRRRATTKSRRYYREAPRRRNCYVPDNNGRQVLRPARRVRPAIQTKGASERPFSVAWSAAVSSASAYRHRGKRLPRDRPAERRGNEAHQIRKLLRRHHRAHRDMRQHLASWSSNGMPRALPWHRPHVGCADIDMPGGSRCSGFRPARSIDSDLLKPTTALSTPHRASAGKAELPAAEARLMMLAFSLAFSAVTASRAQLYWPDVDGQAAIQSSGEISSTFRSAPRCRNC